MYTDPHALRAFLDPAHHTLASEIDAFSAETFGRDLAQHPDDDAARHRAREIVVALGRAGYYAAIAAQDLRGLAIIRETLAAYSPLADAVFALQALGTTPLITAGSPAQREEWLERIVGGEVMTAFAMTEPDAGSDAGALQTVAQRDGDAYVLNGRKTLISNAGIADLYIVFATIDPARGRDGLAALLVPANTSGLRFAAPQLLSAPHPLGELIFDDCRLPSSALIGDEGAGFEIGMDTLDRLRATVAAAACGMAARALHEATHHALARNQFGKPIATFQLVQDKIARMTIELDAARFLTYRAAWEKDMGAERVTRESAVAKAFATEAAQRIVDAAVQIVGGRGVLVTHPVEHLYRAVRALRIYEGTTEIQHLVIARQVLRAAK